MDNFKVIIKQNHAVIYEKKGDDLKSLFNNLRSFLNDKFFGR